MEQWPSPDATVFILVLVSFLSGVWSSANKNPRHIVYAALVTLLVAYVVLVLTPAL